ncbi:MAG: glycerate kinase [Bacteroidales bacterium]|nr:glycerate kinase [Bacteroidales bacterium]
MKKIVIASDSFKGSLSSAEVAEAAADGIRSIYPACEIISLVLGDGGEGTCNAIADTMTCEWVSISAKDPIGRDCNVRYALHTDSEGLTAIIEMAQASGITLLASEELDPLKTSTFGTGQMILDAFERGCRRFIIGLGGSATNDGGTGMLEALGFRFMDRTGRLISGCCGQKLHEITSIDTSMVAEELLSSSFTVVCDVETPFYGKQGATRVFAPQKGASASDIENLESGMQSFASIVMSKYGIDLGKTEGSGAAGGTGGALYAFLNGKLRKGADLILDAVRFEEIIENADLVITGEGRIDSQTFRGKLPSRVLNRADRKGIPVLAIGGLIDLSDEAIGNSDFVSIFAIQPTPASPEELASAMNPSTTAENIRNTIINYLPHFDKTRDSL